MEPTGGNGRRIPLTPEVAQRLRQWPKTVGTKLVFPDPKHGGFRSNSSIRTAFRRARRRGGVEGHARPHDLRHTFASDLGARNVPPETIRRLGGWASGGDARSEARGCRRRSAAPQPGDAGRVVRCGRHRPAWSARGGSCDMGSHISAAAESPRIASASCQYPRSDRPS